MSAYVTIQLYYMKSIMPATMHLSQSFHYQQQYYD